MRKIFIIGLLSILFLFENNIFGQGRTYNGPNDPAGDKAAERTGFMTGNRVLLFYRNTTELSDCCGLGYGVSVWPDNFDGTKMHDGIATLIGSRVYLENDTIPVTSGYENRTDLDTLYYIQSSYREHMDLDPTLTIEYGLYPVFGYFNELSETPAMSNLPESWPTNGWPTSNGTKWTGEWNGRFGRGVVKADLECFFVSNDAQDQEYLEEGNRVKYYPRPNVKIGDIKSDVSIQKGKPWGGIGIRVETRGFQWSNPAANDAIFWEHTIANISDYDLPEMVFGFWMDNAVGGEEGVGDDLAFYDLRLAMSYSWDIDFIPVGGGVAPGVLGFAYLESPGLPNDNIDNDGDGLTNEKRDNVAVSLVGPRDGIDDIEKFLKYYKLKEEDLREHWDADEDQDWLDGDDKNGNNIYDNDEDPGNDIGLDGVAPGTINYTGPDVDGTECNHKPDYVPGIGAEPNFAITDVSESDMLGLTSFHYSSDIDREAIIRTDESLYRYMVDGLFQEFQNEPLNFMEFFASGSFPLYKGQTERISMSEIHSYDPLAGLMSSDHSAPALFRLKEVVQVIYETDYRFAQPPLMPTLSAIPADGKIILTWDNISDIKTRDDFVNNVNDFEGYKLYRATDKKMSDPELITDGYGNPTLKKPIFQCDIIDDIKGFADFGEINGVEYYLGDDTGIQHYFIDEDVDNGRTYYYVLVAYDYGISDLGDGISPSENNFIIRLDESEDVVEISKNVAIVSPHQFAAGYIDPSIKLNEDVETLGGSDVKPLLTVFNHIKPNHTYRVFFEEDTITYLRLTQRVRHYADALFTNSGFKVFDVTLGDSLVYWENANYYSGENVKKNTYTNQGGSEYDYFSLNTNIVNTGVFDGLQFQIMDFIDLAKVNKSKIGWISGSSPIQIKVNEIEGQFFPWQYNIIFTNDDNAYTTKTTSTKKVNDAFNKPIGPLNLLLNQNFNFYVINKSLPTKDGEFEKLDMVVNDKNGNGLFDYDEDEVIVGYTVQSGSRTYWAGTVFSIDFSVAFADNNLPENEDQYQVDFLRPFKNTDYIEFTVLPATELNENKLKTDMDNIQVVPNPYVMTNSLESSVTNFQLNQKRRLMFTNIPANSIIKIFTISGVFIRDIYVDNSTSNKLTKWDTNSAANGTAFWDLKSKEGLDVAAGYYIYHIKSIDTGKEKVGKFAIIK